MGNRRGVGRGRKAAIERQACDEPLREIVPSPADQLEYIADMVQQLKAMSAQANQPTLVALLELAHQEALRQRRAG